LLVLSIAVVGGLQSLGGCVAASIVFAGLNELFFRVSALTGYLDVVSALLLAVVLLVYPGGLAAIPAAVGRRLKPVLADSGVAGRAARFRTALGERVEVAVSRVVDPARASLARVLHVERRKQVRVGMFSHITLTKRAVRHEAAAEETVRNAVRFMRLESVADRTVAGLPFGVLRRVEIARTLVAGSPVVMLDEPASGLDNAETDLLSELLVDLRERLGLSLLLIEHDVRMVMSIVDRMYVLVHGKIVSQGTPAEVRDDPVVVKAYLGESAKPAVPAARKANARTTKVKRSVPA